MLAQRFWHCYALVPDLDVLAGIFPDVLGAQMELFELHQHAVPLPADLLFPDVILATKKALRVSRPQWGWDIRRWVV